MDFSRGCPITAVQFQLFVIGMHSYGHLRYEHVNQMHWTVCALHWVKRNLLRFSNLEFYFWYKLIISNCQSAEYSSNFNPLSPITITNQCTTFAMTPAFSVANMVVAVWIHWLGLKCSLPGVPISIVCYKMLHFKYWKSFDFLFWQKSL